MHFAEATMPFELNFYHDLCFMGLPYHKCSCCTRWATEQVYYQKVIWNWWCDANIKLIRLLIMVKVFWGHNIILCKESCKRINVVSVFPLLVFISVRNCTFIPVSPVFSNVKIIFKPFCFLKAESQCSMVHVLDLNIEHILW